MLLEMSGITKYYGDFKANDHISLSIQSGEVLCIVGENGAGKSTIMKILYGLEEASAGEISLDGQPLQLRSPLDAIKHGIGMVQQNFMLFSSFTVAENIVYNLEPRKHGVFCDLAKAEQITKELSQKHGLPIDPRARISELSVGMQQRVEILKLLYQNTDILIFDEPTAVLTPQEISDLLATIRALAEAGKACILITHKLAEVKAVADRVVVMRKGQKVAELGKEELDIPTLSYQMIGRILSRREMSPPRCGERVLTVSHGTKGSKGSAVLDDICLHVDAGEIVGIAGVSGNGQTQLLDCLSGMEHLDEGEILLDKIPIERKSAAELRLLQFSYIPEDRHAMGSTRSADLSENSLMAYQQLPRFAKRGLLKRKQIRDFVSANLKKYQVAYNNLEQRADSLSGGNLQKLIVARELERDSRMVIAAEPTRGVDIGAMEFIHDTLVKKRDAGAAILLISSELSEIIDLSDRIYVMHRGRIVTEKKRGEVAAAELGEYMLGTKHD